MTCERCQAPLEIGMFPFCRGNPADHARGVSAVIGDEMDHLQVNGTPVPIHFTSKADRRDWLKANGLVEQVRHVPLQGTDKSPHTTDWGSRMDDYTANNVRLLLERAFQQRADPVEAPLHLTTYAGDLDSPVYQEFCGAR